jgi:hypothetical protein
MTGGENRRNSILKALRKRRIDHLIYRYYYKDRGYGFYDNLHQYSKNKIHCSCPMCSAKTKNKGRRKKNWWAPPRNYKISDVKKIQKLEYED